MKNNTTAGINSSSDCPAGILWISSFIAGDYELTEYSYGLTVIFFIVNTALLLNSTIGNALVFSTIVFFKRLHITPNIGMANLAVACCLTGLIAHSFLLTSIIYKYNCASLNSQAILFAISCSANFLVQGLLFSLCLVTVERYIGIVYCLRYTTILSVRKMFGGAIVVWTVSFLCCFLDSVFELDHIVTRVIVNITRACILFCNLIILRISYKQRRQIAAQEVVIQNAPPPNFRGAFTVAFIFVILCVTEIPVLATSSVLTSTLESNSRTVLFYPWCLTLFFSKSTLYFIVYFWRSRQLRRYTKQLCGKLGRRMSLVWQ